jgi:hypothetical protein
MFLLGYFVARSVEVCSYIFKPIYHPLTEIVVVVGEALTLSLSTAIVMQWFSVSRALRTADISDVSCR